MDESLRQISDLLVENQAAITGFTAIAALLLTVIGLITSWLTLRQNEKHNRKSVTPIGEMSYSDYNQFSEIRMLNNGIGPLIVNKCSYTFNGENDKETMFKPIVEYLQSLDGKWLEEHGIGYNWSRLLEVENRALSATYHQSFFRIEYHISEPEKFDGKALYEIKNTVRMMLSKIKIKIRYIDMYGDAKGNCVYDGEQSLFASHNSQLESRIPKSSKLPSFKDQKLTSGGNGLTRFEAYHF